MIAYFFLLCLLQLIGEALVYLTGLPIPGPVVGMALLLIGLILKNGLPDGLDHTASGLLKYLALLFVPAGVGVVQHVELIAQEWLPIAASLLLATLLTIVFCGVLMDKMDRRDG